MGRLIALVLLVPTLTLGAVREDSLVSAGWLALHLATPDLRVVHVGADAASFQAGHVPGARFLPASAVGMARDGLDNELPPLADLTASFTALGLGEAGRVVLYGGPGNLLAARALMALDYLGHGDRCALLDGGLDAWSAAGRPTTNVAATPVPAPFTPRLRPEVIVSRTAVADVSWALGQPARSAVRLLDARPAAQYTGETAGAGIPRAGHIPGAANLYWEDALQAPSRRLKPVPELQTWFAAAGVREGDTLITYCRSGGQAAYLYFVARYLGYDVRLYDGSFLDWSPSDLPVATGR